MLRLLAFSPQMESPDENIEQLDIKKKPETKPALKPLPGDQVTPDSKDQVCEQTTREAEVAVRDQPVPEADAPALNQNEADVVLDWPGLAYQLGLSGLSQEIVANSHFDSFRDGDLRLALLPEIHELVTDVIKAEIRQALEQKLEVSLQLDFVAVESQSGQTPLQAKELRQQHERLAAIDAIRAEKTVKKLQTAFAAELDEASVVKIENNSH
jgi:hypothetical protein